MDKSVLQDYTKAIKEFRLAEQTANENGLRVCCFDYRIQIFGGIIELAESVSAEIKLEYTDGVYPYKRTFYYEGVEFFQIEREEENFNET